MKTYRIRITNNSSTLTPFQADTVFGHLCWVVAHNEGEKSLQKFLEPFKDGKPPFVISDGFPTGFLPKPLSFEFGIEDPQERKEMKKIEYLTFNDFIQMTNGKKFRPEQPQTNIISTTIPHNVINRLTYTTFQEAGVYSLKETFIPEVDFYIKVESDEWKNRVLGLFNELSKTGFGRKKSIGKGQFTLTGVEDDFPFLEKGNGFITLSSFCPAVNDPVDGLYKTFVKYGKLGEEFTYCGNPFKRPLLMIKTGSVFRTGDQPKKFYGRLVAGNNERDCIAPAKPEVVQYAYSFAVPILLDLKETKI